MPSDAGLEVVAPAGAELAEGPCWDSARRELIWVDIPAGAVHVLGAGGSSRYDVRRPVGAAIPVDGQRLLVCRQGELSFLDRESGQLEAFADLEPDRGDMRPNDAKCDPAGRLWVNTTRFEHDLPVGTLYRVEADGVPRATLTELWCANGMAWNADASVMFFTDSSTRAVDRLRFDLATGEISERRRFVELGAGEAVPDGMAADSEGGLWVALWAGGCVQRFDPDGRLAAQVDLPVPLVTSCCFGGPELTELFITTARDDQDDSALGGAVFRCDPGVAGLPVSGFAAVAV